MDLPGKAGKNCAEQYDHHAAESKSKMQQTYQYSVSACRGLSISNDWFMPRAVMLGRLFFAGDVLIL
jgi:hypothetical protein